MENAYLGMYRAVVMDNNDPERRGRIRVQCPSVLGNYLSSWCEPCIPYATDYAGDYYVPPVGEGIWVQFEEGNVNKPIWNGGWYKVNSTPLTQKSNPEDYRYIIFKDSVIRMGKREFIFELRKGDKSYTVTISPDTWFGLNYISGFDENKINDLETLIINKDWLLTKRPEEENQMFEELQKLIASLGESYNDFVQNIFPKSVEDIYNQIQKVYEISHRELESVTEQISGSGGIQEKMSSVEAKVNRLSEKLEDAIEVINQNTQTLNEVITALNDLTISGSPVFPDDFPELDEIE